MSPPVPDPPPLDYSALTYPSDRVTVADIRRAHPGPFDGDGDRFDDLDADPAFTLNLALYLERLLARAAYEQALGRPGDVLRDVGLLTRADCVEDLTRFYATYGVAEGPQHTEQLVRDLEVRAAQQAGRER